MSSDAQESQNSLAPLPVADVGVRKFRRSRRVSVSAESDRTPLTTFVPKIIPKSDEALKRIIASTDKSFLFSGLDKKQRATIHGAMEEIKVTKGFEIIKQYDSGDYFYVVDSGKFDVLKKAGGPTDAGDFKKVFYYDNSGSFGELSLMYNCCRAATVKATTDAVLWRVDRETFRNVIIESTARQRDRHQKFISSVPIFAKLTTSEISQIADCMHSTEYKDGEYILKQGDTDSNGFFIIEEGQCKATITPAGKDTEVEVGQIKEGQYFGERAMIKDEARAANVIADGNAKCLSIDRATFERLLGPCRDLMNRQIDDYVKPE